MAGELWLNKEINLLQTLESKEYDLLLRYASENQQYLMERRQEEQWEDYERSIRYGMSLLRYFERHLQEKLREKTVFRLGALMGTLETCDRLSYEEMQVDWVRIHYKEQVLSVKHLDEVVLTLEMHGFMTHSELCESIHMKESTLSEFMKKVKPANLISSVKSGKYKIYRLTDTGRRLGKQLRENRNSYSDGEKILSELKSYLACDERQEFVERVNRLLKENNQTDAKNIHPGDNLSIYYADQGKRKKVDYQVTGISENEPEGIKKIMAKKLNSEIYLFNNVEND